MLPFATVHVCIVRQRARAAPGRDRRESPAQAQVAEQAAFRGRDHRAPCESLDEARKAHARHVKLGVDRSLRHARPLLAACALAADWPGSMAYAASIFAALDDPEAFDYNTLTRDYSASPAAAAPAAALSLACHRRLRVTRRGRRCSVPCLPPMRERKSEREERGRVGGKQLGVKNVWFCGSWDNSDDRDSSGE
uniref:Uncharacterized protein n=1 Tax=Oryza sativa subsp. japonica TaxID=39947 RepID=Q655C4_ORYSJ|nr:hypothetical protein [Oryza sativa Japonica Group]BAD88395.1 hypothetical protein [Oryza sativa Japonica Group]